MEAAMVKDLSLNKQNQMSDIPLWVIKTCPKIPAAEYLN